MYKIDYDGYLLDAEGRYIVNSKYEQVRLTQEQLDLMKEKGLIKWYNNDFKFKQMWMK